MSRRRSMPVVRRVLAVAGLATVAPIAILGVVGAVHRPVSELPACVAGKHVRVDGMRLRYVQAGGGDDVLLIHGSPRSPIMKAAARVVEAALLQAVAPHLLEARPYEFQARGACGQLAQPSRRP